MFEIKKEHCVTMTEKLLFNIWQELKEDNLPCSPAEDAGESKRFTCKICGQTFENAGKYLADQRKHKKEGA